MVWWLIVSHLGVFWLGLLIGLLGMACLAASTIGDLSRQVDRLRAERNKDQHNGHYSDHELREAELWLQEY
jgi:hypothetical protein